MTEETIRVRAVSGKAVARLSARGTVLRDQYVGRDAAGAMLPEGEPLPRHPHYLRALRRGELELVELVD